MVVSCATFHPVKGKLYNTMHNKIRPIKPTIYTTILPPKASLDYFVGVQLPYITILQINLLQFCITEGIYHGLQKQTRE